MSLIKSIDDIDENARTLLKEAFGNSTNRADAVLLISKASVFYPFEYEGNLAFVPSRFVGYRNNSIDEHNDAKKLKQRDGKDTNPAITRILGQPKPDEYLESRFIEFCNGLNATPKGRFPKKFWRIETTKRGAERIASAINDIQLEQAENDDPEYKRRMSGSYVRDDRVRKAVLERAAGRCEYGSTLSPAQQCDTFTKRNGKRYLEAHHVIKLSEQGRDRESNVIALCANHHREAHFGERWEYLQDEFLSAISAKTSK